MSAEKTRRAKSLFCKAAQLVFMSLHGGRLLAPPFMDEFLDLQLRTATVRLGQAVNMRVSTLILVLIEGQPVTYEIICQHKLIIQTAGRIVRPGMPIKARPAL